MLNLYLPNGYVDIKGVRELGLPFNFFVGGRGTGKTYGGLLDCYQNKLKFLFMRRLQAQVDLINKPDFSPFKPLNEDLGCNVRTVPVSKYNSALYNMIDDETGKLVPQGAPLGYTIALSTISNLRGFSASDCKILLFDEFIPEPQERSIKDEGKAFFNAYETINRNRELKGEKPLQVLAFANANDLGNPIFMELGVIRISEQMKRKGQSVYINKDRGLGIFFLENSPISDKKKNTALYKLTGDGAFSAMALNNTFDIDDHMVRPSKLIEYRPIVAIGEICIYKHKSKQDWYVSAHTTGSPETYLVNDIERARFISNWSDLWGRYLNSQVYFEDYSCEIVFRRYFNY